MSIAKTLFKSVAIENVAIQIATNPFATKSGRNFLQTIINFEFT